MLYRLPFFDLRAAQMCNQAVPAIAMFDNDNPPIAAITASEGNRSRRWRDHTHIVGKRNPDPALPIAGGVEFVEAGQKLAARGQELHRLTDLAYLLDGELVLCGRIKDVIIVGGRNIFPEDIERAVKRLRVWTLIEGHRGRKGDPDSVLRAIEAIADFAEAHRDDLLELDVNPLLVLPDRAVAVDALIKTR